MNETHVNINNVIKRQASPSISVSVLSSTKQINNLSQFETHLRSVSLEIRFMMMGKKLAKNFNQNFVREDLSIDPLTFSQHLAGDVIQKNYFQQCLNSNHDEV